jgi:putative PEP-CTERM system histidine kinase
VSADVFATAAAVSYGLAAAIYFAFALRVGFGSRRNARARLLSAALAATALWAATSLLLASSFSNMRLLAADVGDALRYGAWYAFMWHLLRSGPVVGALRSPFPYAAFFAVGAVLALSVLLGQAAQPQGVDALPGPRVAFVLRLGLAVFGLAMAEQVLRRVQAELRWAIKPFVIAMAGVFGLELVYYADAVLFARLDVDFWLARGVANVIVVPFLALATVRNTGWTVDLHLSRRAAFHSTALLASGAFLLLVAIAGYAVRYLGGTWGRVLQIELVFAALLCVALVASSGRFRAKLKVFLSKHFFSYRYDYREEWLRFTQTLSAEHSPHSLQTRVIIALADLVESPGGALFLQEASRGFVASAHWNTPRLGIVERADGPLASFLARTGWIVDVTEYRANRTRYADLALPAGFDVLPSAWLVVPLLAGTELLGFVVLTTPRTALGVDWEVRDLLKTAARQAASYLGQVRASEALLEARKFEAFNRMSAFVVHDLKNLIAQLSLMLKNAQRHRDNPAFQADMLATVAHVVERMNALMMQLRTGSRPVDNPRQVDVNALVQRVCATKSGDHASIEIRSDGPVAAFAHEDRLEHVFGHLLQNAIDASPAQARIDVRVERRDSEAVVVVTDRGAGMSADFVRDRLFKPFQTTKPSGMGIGVYESAQYVAGIGGRIEVSSEENVGTSVEVYLPYTEPAPGSDAAHAEERVA